ncbi:hypothetical protein Droror1_Dr00000089 [Drosera rotundifolia]
MLNKYQNPNNAPSCTTSIIELPFSLSFSLSSSSLPFPSFLSFTVALATIRSDLNASPLIEREGAVAVTKERMGCGDGHEDCGNDLHFGETKKVDEEEGERGG